MNKSFNNYFLALLIIPNSNFKDNWLELKYNKVAQNSVQQIAEGSVSIKVNKSASPLVHKLAEPLLVKSAYLKINLKSNSLKQASDVFPEDAYIRLGFVALGERKLSKFQRMLAPDWISTLYSLAPKNIGIDKIYFYNIVDNEVHLKQKRSHPKSDVIQETIFAVAQSGVSEFTINLETPLNIGAIWISSDGDDSAATYEIEILKLQLN